jgi:uncharacterized membrane protein
MSFCENCGARLPEGNVPCRICAGHSQTTYGAGTMPTQATPGMQANGAGALAYLAGFITGIIFLLIDPFKTDRFVRFHAFQSIFFNVAWIALWIAWMILGFVLGAITKGFFFLIEMPINLMLMLGGFCLWAYLMYSAYQKKTFKLPVVGALAAKQAGL